MLIYCCADQKHHIPTLIWWSHHDLDENIFRVGVYWVWRGILSAKLEVAVSCLPLNGIALLAVYGVLGGNSSFILRTHELCQAAYLWDGRHQKSGTVNFFAEYAFYLRMSLHIVISSKNLTGNIDFNFSIGTWCTVWATLLVVTVWILHNWIGSNLQIQFGFKWHISF